MLKSEVSNDLSFFVPSCFLIIAPAHPMGKGELLSYNSSDFSDKCTGTFYIASGQACLW